MTEWIFPEGYISKRIHDIFTEVAEIVALMDLPEDVAAAIPMAIFSAENYMLSAWRAYLASLSEPDNLKHITNGKEADREPGLSGSESEAGLRVAEVEFVTRECGHGEMAVKNGTFHHLCARCDEALCDGYSDEEQRYQKWLKRRRDASQSD